MYCLFRSVHLQCSVCFQSLCFSNLRVSKQEFLLFSIFSIFSYVSIILTTLLYVIHHPSFILSLCYLYFHHFLLFFCHYSVFFILFLFKFPFSLISHFLFQTSPSVFYVRFPYLPCTTKPIFNKICIPLQMDEQEVTNA